MQMGFPSILTLDAAKHAALSRIYQQVGLQASLLAYRDTYNFIAVILVVLAIAALFMPKDHHQKTVHQRTVVETSK